MRERSNASVPASTKPDLRLDNYARFRRHLKGHNVWLRLRRLVTLLFLGAVYKYTYLLTLLTIDVQGNAVPALKIFTGTPFPRVPADCTPLALWFRPLHLGVRTPNKPAPPHLGYHAEHVVGQSV